MRCWIAGLAVIAALGGIAPIEAQADSESWSERAAGVRPLPGVRSGRSLQGIDTIQYDPGAPQGVRGADQGFTFLGNLFDTQNGTPLTGGSLSGVIFYAGQVGAKGPSSVFMRVEGPSSSFSSFLAANPYAFNTLAFSPVNIGAPFVVDFFAPGGQQPPLGTGARIGFNSASYNGQGFHAVQRTFTGASTAIPNQNMVIRAVGSVAIPVELLEFEVE